MMKETIQAKDNVIMALSSQVDNMQGEANSPTLRDDLIDFSEPFHDSLKVGKRVDAVDRTLANWLITRQSARRTPAWSFGNRSVVQLVGQQGSLLLS